MLITVDFVMGHDPCGRYTRKRVAKLLGPGKTLLECLRSKEVTAEDRIWLATREGACSERVQRLFACWCAEQVLPLFEAEHPDDDRPRMAIQVAVAYAEGEATKDAMASASDAARAAASAGWSAASAAASAAAWSAAWSAASAAASAAAWVALATARAAQVAAFIELLETHGE